MLDRLDLIESQTLLITGTKKISSIINDYSRHREINVAPLVFVRTPHRSPPTICGLSGPASPVLRWDFNEAPASVSGGDKPASSLSMVPC
jgi:hypothetical protein